MTDVAATRSIYKHEDYLLRQTDYYALTKYKILLTWLPNETNLRVLNVGCGSGEMNVLLGLNETWTIDAIDIDEIAIKLSNQIVNESRLKNINIMYKDIQSHDPQYRYDVVVATDVMEHIETDQLFINKARQLLKPGGLFLISVPALQWLYGYHDEMLGHYRRYNRRSLLKLLEPLYSVKICRYFGGSLIPLAIIYSKLFRCKYPISRQSKNGIKSSLLKYILYLDAKYLMPFGTSLLASSRSK